MTIERFLFAVILAWRKKYFNQHRACLAAVIIVLIFCLINLRSVLIDDFLTLESNLTYAQICRASKNHQHIEQVLL